MGPLQAADCQVWQRGEVIIVDPANNRAVVVAGEDVWLVNYTTTNHLQIGTRQIRTLTFKKP